MSRSSQLYSFCALTNRCRPRLRAVHSASATCQPVKFDEPR